VIYPLTTHNIKITFPLAACSDGDLHLVVGEEYTDYYQDKEGVVMGRIEVCIGRRYGTVCGQFWRDSYQEASVVCRQLEFSPYGG